MTINNVLHCVVERNLRAAMRCYARVNSHGEARDYPGVTVASCGMDCAVFNSAMLNGTAEATTFDRLLTLASVHFRQRSLGWTLWLCDDLVPDSERSRARASIRNARLESIAQPPGMYAERLTPARRPPARLDIRPVNDDTTRLDFAHLSSVIFNLAFPTSRDIYGSADLWRGSMSGWVGYLEGRAVSIVAVVVAGGVAGIYSVGTLREFQGRGFAETMVRYALDWAHETAGTDASVLQSTSAGLPLYQRLGYRVVTRFGVYLNEGNDCH